LPDPDPDSRDTDEPPPIVEVRGLGVRRAGRSILGPLDWTVGAGERWVVLGPNGSGKTTLLSTIGLDLWPMALGGLVASLLVALLAGLVSRVTPLKEDASLAGFYLISISSGVLIISLINRRLLERE